MAYSHGFLSPSYHKIVLFFDSRPVYIVGQIFLWLFLFLLIGVNVIAVRTLIPGFQRLSFVPLEHPYSVSAHVETAKRLWDAGYRRSAMNELVIAQEIIRAGGGSVLGATSDPTALLSAWQNMPSQLTQAYMYWTKILSEKPDYRDGYLMAGAYAYQLGKLGEAKKLFQKAYELNPNYDLTEKILKKIQY